MNNNWKAGYYNLVTVLLQADKSWSLLYPLLNASVNAFQKSNMIQEMSKNAINENHDRGWLIEKSVE